LPASRELSTPLLNQELTALLHRQRLLPLLKKLLHKQRFQKSFAEKAKQLMLRTAAA
jgi:hypothetical protein